MKLKVSWLPAFLWCMSQTRRDWNNSRRVRTHERNSDWIGHNNTKHFLCPIRSRHPLEFLEIARWESVPRGSFARTWKLSSCPFSRPDWLPLGLRGCIESNARENRRRKWLRTNNSDALRASLGKRRFPKNASPFGRRSLPPSIK